MRDVPSIWTTGRRGSQAVAGELLRSIQVRAARPGCAPHGPHERLRPTRRVRQAAAASSPVLQGSWFVNPPNRGQSPTALCRAPRHEQTGKAHHGAVACDAAAGVSARGGVALDGGAQQRGRAASQAQQACDAQQQQAQPGQQARPQRQAPALHHQRARQPRPALPHLQPALPVLSPAWLCEPVCCCCPLPCYLLARQRVTRTGVPGPRRCSCSGRRAGRAAARRRRGRRTGAPAPPRSLRPLSPPPGPRRRTAGGLPAQRGKRLECAPILRVAGSQVRSRQAACVLLSLHLCLHMHGYELTCMRDDINITARITDHTLRHVESGTRYSRPDTEQSSKHLVTGKKMAHVVLPGQ